MVALRAGAPMGDAAKEASVPTLMPPRPSTGVLDSRHRRNYNMVVDKLWREWNITALLPQAAAAREAQKRLIAHHAKLGRIAARYASRRTKATDMTDVTNGKIGSPVRPVPMLSIEAQRIAGRLEAAGFDT
ncbi:MAG: hypothetical protein HY332_12880 [Chloroflexi bacterium]|nr:hypothetical protein [Chloroflexota bacterium]